VTSLCFDPLLAARHPLRCVCLLQKNIKMCSICEKYCFTCKIELCTATGFKFVISVFVIFASILQIIYLYTVKYPETTFYNRSIQYNQQTEVVELPLHELEIRDSGPQFIVQKWSFSQKLKLLKFCSFRNFTHTPTHATEYLILIQLNYLNTLWNLSILVWCWRIESSFDCPAASFTKLLLALL